MIYDLRNEDFKYDCHYHSSPWLLQYRTLNLFFNQRALGYLSKDDLHINFIYYKCTNHTGI